MSLLLPAGLLLGLTLPIVVIFYLLRVRRTDEPVSSIFLWRAMPRDLAAQEPLQRLRPNVLLFLQLVLLALLTAALARPAVIAVSHPPVHLVLLLDASASMQAVDPRQASSRFERARAAAEAAIRDAPAQSRFSVLEARGHPQLLLSRDPDAARALEAVRSAQVSGASADMAEALLLARSLGGAGVEQQILVFTDQAFSLSSEERHQLGANVEVVPMGGPAPNIAVTALRARPRLAEPQVQDLFVRLQSFSPGTRSVAIELRVADEVRERHSVDLVPDSSAEFVFGSLPTAAGSVSVAVREADDQLPLDDAGYLALQGRRPSQILLVSNGDPRIERALSLVRGSEVFKIAPRRYLAADVDRFDVVVFDREVPPLLPRGNVLVLGPSGSAPFLPPGPPQVLRQPQALTWDHDHPLLAYVDLRGLSIRRAHVLDPPPWSRVLAHGDGAPLMLAGHDSAGRRVVVLGFAPVDSNLGILPAFPILVNNLIDWLAPPALLSRHQVATGGSVDLMPLPRARDVLVTTPDGQSGRVVIPISSRDSPISFAATDLPGIYTVEQRAQDGSLLPEATERFAANLANPAESDLRPRPDSVFSTVVTAAAPVPLPRELWTWVLAFAIPLLALEGWWFHRRA